MVAIGLQSSLTSDDISIVTIDLRSLHRAALALADRQVAELRAADLERPTPCADWNLAELLAHMIGQHRGFAQAVRDGDAPVAAYRPVPFELSAWQDSVVEVQDAFARADPDATAVAAELTSTPLPVAQLIAAQLLDTVVHTWDVAQAIGVEFTPPAELLAATEAIAVAVPDRAYGRGRAFARRLAVGGDDDAWRRTLALLGRRAETRNPS